MQRRINRIKIKRKYIIPLSCLIALLALFSINLGNSNKCYAAEPSISLSVAEPSISNTGIAGEEISISNDVSITGTLINSYSLQISGNPTLEGSTTINSITTETSTLPEDSWGYKWNNTGNYKGISTTPTTIISNAGLDTTGTISSTNNALTFSAKFSNDAEAGHYKTSVNLLLTATPKELYKLAYNAVGGTGAPTTQECSTYDSCMLTLDVSKPTKANYAFIGWDTNSVATTVAYRPKERISLTENQTLYAVWKPLGIWEVNGSTTNAGSNNMQDIISICSKVSTPATTASDSAVPKIYLQDTRDGSTYTVRKLADGKCWMTDNLHLRLTAGAPIIASVNATANGTYTWNTTSGEGAIESTIEEGKLTSTDFSGSDYYRIQSYITTPTPAYNNSTDTGKAINYAGETGYYSYTAATAGSATSSVTSGEANYSICPKGWRLPLGSSSSTTGSFYNTFYTKYGITQDAASSTKIRDLPFNFQYTGRAGSGSLSNSASGGYWWSSTVNSTNYSYRMYANSSDVNPGTDYYYRYYGFAVRCVSQEAAAYSITYNIGNSKNWNSTTQQTFTSTYTTQESTTPTITTHSTAKSLGYDDSNGTVCAQQVDGWSTTDGGALVYSLGQSITLTESNPKITLYPHLATKTLCA